MVRTIIILILFLSVEVGFAQSPQPLPLTLEEAMLRARKESVEAEVALNKLRSAYWEYRAYKAELLPEVSLSASLPSYRKQYSSYMNNEGSFSFVRNNYLQMTGEVSVAQNIWLTGGKVALTSSLDFYRQLGNGSFNRFMSIPVALTLSQPLFGVNNIKWDRKIEPVRYEEAKAEFLSATEDVAAEALRRYFSLLMAKENHEIALQNVAQAEKLYEVAKEKREMGRISRNDLLQMELNLLDANSYLTDCESTLKSNMFQLSIFLGYDSDMELVVSIPMEAPDVEINYQFVYERALNGNSFAKTMLRKQLEADYEVAKAKGAQREINLFAQVGFTGTDHNIGGSYSNLKDNQVVEVGVSLPILDWGRRKGKVKVAESNRKLVESQVRQEYQNFSSNLFILVERYSNQQKQVERAKRADEIAAQRYATNVETYLIGKISTLDLNDSRVKKDEARREYVNELYLFWNYYYQIRSLSLWDYRKNCEITDDFDQILAD